MLSRSTLVAAVPALFALISACWVAAAQDIEIRRPQNLVSRQEGEAIVQATLQHRAQIRNKPDCSHWVHDVYGQAGLDYEMAASKEIFSGIESFQRVRKPQPGDLIVWQGHVGIVIDPEDHSFYSSVNSGFSISSYVSSYWRSRGIPRFYRYKIDALQSARLLNGAADHREPPTPGNEPLRSESQSIASAETPENFLPSASHFAAVNAVNNDEAAKNLSWRTEQGDVHSGLVAGEDSTPDPVLISTGRKPTKEEVRLRVIGFGESDTEKLLQTDSSYRPIEIIDRVDVDRIETHGKFGSVELRIKKIASFTDDGGVRLASRFERVRLGLLQQPEGWILFAPPDRIYLPRQAAVKLLAARIAVLARSPADSQQLKSLARALKMLARGQS